MSNTALIESHSADPVERALARRALRILNDRTLDRTQRVTLVRKVQRELLQHQAQERRQAALVARAAAAALPSGWHAESVQASEGRLQVGAMSRARGFTWIDAGEAPPEVISNERAQTVSRSKAANGAGLGRSLRGTADLA